jgi:uncharacterized protein YbcI
MRHLFQETMKEDFTEAVERLTGRRVVAFISGNHVDPDIAVELFILDGTPGRGGSTEAVSTEAVATPEAGGGA